MRRRDAIEEAFAVAEASADSDTHFALKELLVAEHTPTALARHFELIRRSKNDALLQMLATFFTWHELEAVPFLSERARGDTDDRLRAVALQILGKLGSRRKDSRKPALETARTLLDDPSAVVRSRAVMVLGWVGSSKDVPPLLARLSGDTSADVRAMAASQLVFLAEASTAMRSRALVAFAEALELEAERSSLVRDAIVDAAESLLKRRMGVKSDRDARVRRAAKALSAFRR